VVGVVRPGPLGGDGDQAVLAVDELEEVVDGRVGDAFGDGLGACHVRPPGRSAAPATGPVDGWCGGRAPHGLRGTRGVRGTSRISALRVPGSGTGRAPAVTPSARGPTLAARRARSRRTC